MAQTITITRLYEIIQEKRGKEEAEALTRYIEEKIAAEYDKNKSGIVTELKPEIEKGLRNQLWAMIALFIPMYTALAIFFFNYFKH